MINKYGKCKDISLAKTFLKLLKCAYELSLFCIQFVTNSPEMVYKAIFYIENISEADFVLRIESDSVSFGIW